MEYFTYKKVKKCNYVIVLLTVVNKEYIGLSREKFYKLKSHDLIEMYNFIVCMHHGKYLIPIGYSDIKEWMQQEKYIKKYKMFNEEFEDLEDIKNAVKVKYIEQYGVVV